MEYEILMAVLRAAVLFLLNPLLIVSLFAAVLLGYFRVKRERKSFRVRLLPGLTELKRLLSESWLSALLLSILISGIGLVVDAGWLVLFCFVSLVSLLLFNYKLTSPIYFAGAAFGGLYLLSNYAEGFTYRGWAISDVNLFGELVITVPILAGMLLFVEGLLINRYGAVDASPYLKKTSRGLNAGVFKAKRLWLLPILFLVPGEMMTAYVPYWPQFTLGEAAFTFVPVPLIIGFSQVARSSFPDVLFPKIGRAIMFTGVVVIAAGIAAMWMPILGVTALIAGVVARIAISIVASIREQRNGYVLAPSSAGVIIAGVVPYSPGERMGILPGETIHSVNGQKVSNEKELYDAIQINAAHCRLQVAGRDGEMRLMQQVIYRHDHHRLGLLVVR